MIGRLIALVVCAVAVVGLYFVVQTRPPSKVDDVMIYKPGTYQGAPDEPLDKQQEEALRQRVGNQNAL
ncbi:hypothetical protein SAMN06265365_108128 [Tistlia consotensis]|uniref:Uncharacterized protein n=1 Tax=Tistlia consotensis USBA 355 TaxID=560819 RepID=A0A1Y6BQL3_9PROT|nr:hypothetical protein [Tistlia consotensis]SMF23914.1 hypothetical protein SAMN05428998_10852 [Tistlia consotensis USBA 355]SNR61126.1 hypothetical protein SAMN06265365_108128 [Tistlia consotensis]